MPVPACALLVLTRCQAAFATPPSHRLLVLGLAAILTTGGTDGQLPAPHRARAGTGAWILRAVGVFPAPLVRLGAGARLEPVPSRRCGLTRAGAARGRRSGHRAPGPHALGPGPAAR